MGNVLKPHRKIDLLALVRAKHSFRDIEERLGIRRETISKYASEAGLWPLCDGEPEAESKPATKFLEVATGFCESIIGKVGPPIEVQSTDKSANKVIVPKRVRSACESWHEWIVGEVKKGRNAMSIYQDLVERFGFSNRYNSVKRYVRSLKRINNRQQQATGNNR